MEKIERCSKCGDDHTDNQRCRKLSRNERRLLKKNSNKSNPPPEYSLKDATFCPYCGEHPEHEVAKQYYPNDTLDMFFVKCPNKHCPVQPRTAWCGSLEKALIAWNTRTTQEEGDAIAHQGLAQLYDESQADIRNLRGVLKELQSQIKQINDGDRPYTGFDTELIDEALKES